jgi:hypothetical protein
VLPATTQRSSKSSLLDRCEVLSSSLPSYFSSFSPFILGTTVVTIFTIHLYRHSRPISTTFPTFVVPYPRFFRDHRLMNSGSPYPIDRSGKPIPTPTI